MGSRNLVEQEFTEEEIHVALMSCNGDKAPVPDDYNMRFLQEFWDIIKSDIVAVFNEFYESRSFVKSLNSRRGIEYERISSY